MEEETDRKKPTTIPVTLEEGECKKMDEVVVCKEGGKLQVFKKKEE